MVLGVLLGLVASRLLLTPQGATPDPSGVVAGGSATADDGGEDAGMDDAAPTTAPAAGQVTLDAPARRLAAIHSAGLAAVTVTPEVAVQGQVADTAAFLGALADLVQARAVAAAQRTTVEALAARLARLRGFAARGEINVSRELAALEVEHQREQAHAVELAARAVSLAGALATRWGELVVVVEHDAALRDDLGAGRTCLLELVLASGAAVPTTAFVAADGERRGAAAARVLAAAPAVLGRVQGSTWFAGAPCAGLRAGLRVGAWLPAGEGRVEGVLLPASAVVWHDGTRWFYVEDLPGHYQRQPLVDALPHGSDFVIATPAAAVVVEGAQALLAEEQRAYIPEEDDDD